MTESTNLASKIEKQLPAELVDFMRLAGEFAASQWQNLYLVGGVVRDLLLGRPNFDIDLVVEGSAISLVPHLPQINQAKVVTHPRFGTAKVQWHQWCIDLATARTETYARPGALPSVKPSSISDDLFRRDFTINAMAVHLNPSRYGELVDRYGGEYDIEQRLLRVLQENSFIDDATRIWRALRYEQRLGFHIESNTQQLLQRDLPMLDTISGDRIRYELECIFQEEYPERVLRQAEELRVLPKLHPALKGNGWLAARFKQAREISPPQRPPIGLYLALLTYALNGEQNESLISYLRLPKALAQILRDSVGIKAKIESLADPELNPSRIYRLLHSYSPQAVLANSLATESIVASQHLRLFLNKLRYIKPILTGNDLVSMGIARGPRIKEILGRLREARLDGEISSREDEEKLVKTYSRHLN